MARRTQSPLVLLVSMGLVAATLMATAPSAPAASKREALVLGDSVMVDGEPGVKAALEATGALRVVRAAGPGFGFTRKPWKPNFRSLLRTYHPRAVVIMMGGWDLKPAAAHPQRFAHTIDAAMQLLSGSGAFVVWVGMPPGDPRFIDDARRRIFNGIVAAEARRLPLRVTYVAPEPIFDGPDGKYAMFLPGADGSLVRIRKVDGQHLCPDGAARLGRAALDALRAHVHLPAARAGWEQGTWRREGVYTNTTSFDARTLVLTKDVCPPFGD